MRIVLAGGTTSTRLTLEALLRHRAELVGVLQLRPESAQSVTGFEPLDVIAEPAGVPCVTFRNINDAAIVEQVRQWRPDVLFVAGLSQLIHRELMDLARLGCIGFHPTFLPAGRGRAPLAWLVMDHGPGAATFFLIEEGADSGPIFVQEPFEVTPRDDANDVGEKLNAALVRALDRWLPKLLAGEWNPQPQNELLATWNGKRGPEDGLIDWNQSAREIHTLIRATSNPHPGAYCWLNDRKLIVWRADLEEHLPWRGVPGRVLLLDAERGALLQTGDGLLWLTQVQWSDAEQSEPAASVLKVGQKLSFTVQDELAALRKRVSELEANLRALTAR